MPQLKMRIGASWKPQTYTTYIVAPPQINKMTGNYVPAKDNPPMNIRSNSEDFLAVKSKGFST